MAGPTPLSFAHSAVVIFQEYIAQSVTQTSLRGAFPSAVKNAPVTSTGAASNAGSLSGPTPLNIHAPTGKCYLCQSKFLALSYLIKCCSQMKCHFDGLYSEAPAGPPLPMPQAQTSRPWAPTPDAIPTDVCEPPVPLPTQMSNSMTAQSPSPTSPLPADGPAIPNAATTNIAATTRTGSLRRSGRQTRRPNYFVPS